MPMTLDEFKTQVRADLDAIFGLEARLVPAIKFKQPTTTVNLDPPKMTDEEVRERFRNDPNLKELTTGGIRYERI